MMKIQSAKFRLRKGARRTAILYYMVRPVRRYFPVRWAIAAAIAVTGLHATEVTGPAYQGRRAELRKKLTDGVIVLFGRTLRSNDDLRSGFWQEPNFAYLTGWREPGAVLLLDSQREILFVPKKNPDVEKWEGAMASPEDPQVKTRTGVDTVLPVEKLETELRRSLETTAKFYALPGETNRAKLTALSPFAEISSPAAALAQLRMRKSAQEIDLIRQATDITMKGHRAGWKRAASGAYEFQVAAAMSAVFLDAGCERHAYAPIVGSGINSVFLHYARNTRRMDSGEVLLMDVAAECSGYASDITRTIPVNGKFSKRQKELYEIVLGAQKAAIAAIRPGVTIGRTTPDTIHKIAYDYIDSHGKDKEGRSLGRYFTHGLSHHVGLEVHDASDPATPLEAGMVITVEPGIYIPEESIGIRIEDVVLVTEKGAKVLSEALPREADEIERALHK